MFEQPMLLGLLVVSGLFGLAVLLPSLALGWRRLQDANLHGGLTFISLGLQVLGQIPGIGVLFGLAGTAWWIVVGTLSTKVEGQRFDRP